MKGNRVIVKGNKVELHRPGKSSKLLRVKVVMKPVNRPVNKMSSRYHGVSGKAPRISRPFPRLE